MLSQEAIQLQLEKDRENPAFEEQVMRGVSLQKNDCEQKRIPFPQGEGQFE